MVRAEGKIMVAILDHRILSGSFLCSVVVRNMSCIVEGLMGG